LKRIQVGSEVTLRLHS